MAQQVEQKAAASADEFDTTCKGPHLKLKGNTASTKGATQSILMKNTLKPPNKYEWSFKIEKMSAAAGMKVVIGILKADADPNLSGMFMAKKAGPKWQSNGYAFIADQGKLSNPDEPKKAGADYAVKCKKGDVLTMRLDLHRCELSYSVNGKDYGPAFKVERTQYRAALSLQLVPTAVTLL